MKPYRRVRHRQPTPQASSRRLTLNERLTLLASVASVLVALASFLVSWRSAIDARDNTDIRKAIANLSALAVQTKRQADNSAAQVALLQSQSKDSREQTRAISGQTNAITASSAATIRAADAQREVSIDATNAARPRFGMRTFNIDKTGDNLSDQSVTLSITFFFKNTGTTPARMQGVNFDFSFGSTRPLVAPFMGRIAGNDMVVTSDIDSGLSPSQPIKLTVSKAIHDRFVAGNLNLLFYGEIAFFDIRGDARTECFSYTIENQLPGRGITFRPADKSGLRCS